MAAIRAEAEHATEEAVTTIWVEAEKSAKDEFRVGFF